MYHLKLADNVVLCVKVCSFSIHCLHHHHLSSEVHHPGGGGGGKEGGREEGKTKRGKKWDRRGRKDSHT